jgi:hypothetical protein
VGAVAQLGQKLVAGAQHVRGPEQFRELAVVGLGDGSPAEQQPCPLPRGPVRPVQELREAVRGGPVPQIRTGAVAQVLVVVAKLREDPQDLAELTPRRDLAASGPGPERDAAGPAPWASLAAMPQAMA